MKKFVLLTLFFGIIAIAASAQDCDTNILGTKTLYTRPAAKYTPAPGGYMPVFINHVGRHGARHLTKGVESYSAYTILLKADSVGALSADGIKLKQMVLALQKVEQGNTKFISAEGKAELQGIGEREYQNYSSVFAGTPAINVHITKEVRTKQSADAFLAGLNKQLITPVSPEEKNDDVDLRFYDLSPAYKKFEDAVDESEPKTSFDKALHLNEISKAITAKFFKPDFLKSLNDGKQEKFVSDIFGFASIVYSLQAEVKQAGYTPKDVDFKSFFTCGQATALSELDSADEYLKKGPGVDNNGIQVRVAVPLLVDFINTADEFIKTGKYNAQLRFAHAETIAPFAALLQISGADKASSDIQQIGKVWQASKVIPLSSNIQWVFYKKKGSDDYLVKILLNEQEARITGLKTAQGSYYNWETLRKFYMNKLAQMHVVLTDDMQAYLSSLK
jgi:hypothetical protein